jgi:hypothetical protein
MLLLLVQGGRSWLAVRGLERDLSKLRDAGQPVYPVDFAPRTVPFDDDAAPEIRAAGGVLEIHDRLRIESNNVWLLLPWTEAETSLIRSVLARDVERAALGLLASAAGKGDAQWARRENLQWLSGAESSARLLARAALLAHVEGREADAVRHVREMLELGRAVSRRCVHSAHVVATGIEGSACDVIDEMAPTLVIAAKDGGVSSGPSVPVAEVRALMDCLLDDRGPKRGLVEVMHYQRLHYVQSMLMGFESEIEWMTGAVRAGSISGRGALLVMGPTLVWRYQNRGSTPEWTNAGRV